MTHTIDMSACACCGSCCLTGPNLRLILSTPLANGDCTDCAFMPDLVDSTFCIDTEYRMHKSPNLCFWTGCCIGNPCFTLHDNNPDCGAVTPAFYGYVTETAGTNPGTRKITLEFIMNPTTFCAPIPEELIATYELDNIDPETTPCCGIELPKTFDLGTCTFPAFITVECIEGDCEV